VTCSNLYKLEQDLKVQPYYKAFGEHAEGCNFRNEALAGDHGPAGHGDTGPALDPEAPDVFHLSRPANHFTKNTSAAAPDAATVKRAKAHAIRSSGARGSRQRHYYSVSNLVSRWLRMRDEGRLDSASLVIDNVAVTYRQLFKNMWSIREQEAARYAEAQHVYWGKAWAERLPYGYRIAFDERLLAERELRRPSLLLRDAVIESCAYKKRIVSNLQKAVESDKGGCVLFVYGTPALVPDLASATDTTPSRSFVNFDVSDLDMMDAHPLSLFDRLRTAK
jgi:hypothetical protein